MATIYQKNGQSLYDNAGKTYDAKTGQEYNPNQITVAPQTSQNYSNAGGTLTNGMIPAQYAPTGQESYTINSSTITPTGSIQVPPTPTDTTNYSGMVAGGNATIGANTAGITTPVTPAPTTPDTTQPPSWIQKYITGITPPSASEQYNKDYNNAGIAGLQTDFNAKQQALLNAQSKLSGINAQLAGINAEAQAIPIQAQKDATGREITAGGLQPITTGQLRDNALKALPLQAQALGAQAEVAAAQGNAQLSQSILQQAQDHLDKVYQIHQADATAQYNYQTNLIDRAYQYADKEQQRALDNKKTELATNNSQYNAFVNDIRSIADISKTGDASISSKMTELLNGLNPNSKTFTEDFQKANTKLAELQAKLPNATLETQIKQAQLANLQLEGVEKKQKITESLPGVVSAKAKNEALSQLSLVDELLQNDRYAGVVGINRLNPFTYIPGTEVQYARNQFNQLKAGLSLENREKLKGSGAISDFESRTLAAASSALGTNLSNEDAKRELKKIRGAFANASGLPSLVQITDPSSGKSVIVNATRETINQAIIDGAKVEYK